MKLNQTSVNRTSHNGYRLDFIFRLLQSARQPRSNERERLGAAEHVSS